MTIIDVFICMLCMMFFAIGGYYFGELEGDRGGYMRCVSEEDNDEIRNYSGRPRVEVKL